MVPVGGVLLSTNRTLTSSVWHRSLLGVLLVVATLAGLRLTHALEASTVVLAGLVLLFVGAELAAQRGGLTVALACVAPGAALLATAGYEGADWFAPAVGLTIVVVAPLASDADRHWARRGAAPLWYALACIGQYVCVPDTEEARVLLVASFGAAGISLLLLRWRAFGPGGTSAAIGLFVWIAAVDARGRPAAFIGAVGALGLLALEPLGRRLWASRAPKPSSRASTRPGRARTRPNRVAFLALLATQPLLAAYSGRVVGLEPAPKVALTLLIPALAVGVAAGFLAARGSGPRSDRPQPPGAPHRQR